jgi:hypothetical protein
VFFFSAKFRQKEKNKNKKGIFCLCIPVFSLRKKSPNFEIIFWDNHSPNLDSAFSLVPVFFGYQVANSLFLGCQVGSSAFFLANFRHFAFSILEKNILSQIHYHKNPKAQERDFLFKNSPKFSTTAYNMGQGVLKDFSTFIF